MLEALRHRLGSDRIPAHLTVNDIFATHTYRRTRNPLDEMWYVAGHSKCAVKQVSTPRIVGRRFEGFHEDITYVAFPLPHANGNHFAICLLLVSNIEPGSIYLIPEDETPRLKIIPQRTVAGSESFSKAEAFEFMKTVEQGQKLAGFPDAYRGGENITTHWSRPEMQRPGRPRLSTADCKASILVRMPPGNNGTIRGILVHQRPSFVPFHHLRHRRRSGPH